MFIQTLSLDKQRVLDKERRVDSLTDDVRHIQLQLCASLDESLRLVLQSQLECTKKDLSEAKNGLIEATGSLAQADRRMQELMRSRAFPTYYLQLDCFCNFPKR